MATIVPAILETTKEGFLDKLSRVQKIPGVQKVQIDFADGEFVPHTILPIEEIDSLNPAFSWEAHLMVKNPSDFLDYKIAGFSSIIIHYEAFDLPTKLRLALRQITKDGLEPILCLNPETSISSAVDFLDVVNHFQIMGVHPGFQGADFLPGTIDRVAELRKMCPNAIINVDGGIEESNIKQVALAGADFIVVGSALLKAPDIHVAYEKLKMALG